LSHAGFGAVTIGHRGASTGVVGVDGVRSGFAVGRLIGGTHSRLLHVIGGSGVQVGHLY
jgi:hypothetical protein